MRAFIAIELPKNIIELLAKAQEILQESQADVKWVAKENLHLTLKFLDEINEEEKDKIVDIIKTTAHGYPTFKTALHDLGAFPKEKNPRIIWAGLDNQEQFREIAKDLEEKINKLGIPKEERSFKAHITMGRVKSNKNLSILSETLSKNAGLFKNSDTVFEIKKITLFKSTLLKDGPLYERLYEVNLKTS